MGRFHARFRGRQGSGKRSRPPPPPPAGKSQVAIGYIWILVHTLLEKQFASRGRSVPTWIEPFGSSCFSREVRNRLDLCFFQLCYRNPETPYRYAQDQTSNYLTPYWKTNCLYLKAPRRKCIWKCLLLKSSAANNCLHYRRIKYRSKQRSGSGSTLFVIDSS